MDHHGETALHVRGPETMDPVPFHGRPDVALERHGVEMANQQDRFLARLADDQRVCDGLGGQRVEPGGDGVPKTGLIPGHRWDVDEPAQCLDQIGHNWTPRSRR